MEPRMHAWQEEELEEQEVADLLGRQFRQRNNNSEANEVEEAEQNGAEEAERREENGTEEAGKTQESGYSKSVYFESHQGIWKCRHCYWTYRPPSLVLRGGSAHGVSGMEYNAIESSASDTSNSSEDSDLRKNKFEIQTSPTTEANCQNGKTLAKEILSGLIPATAQKLHDRNIKNVEDLHNSAEGDAEDVLIDEIGNEFTDSDVERVLQKQNTHDLYCPNCNSCITRRVVLRRRRKRVRNIHRSQKPGNKVEARESDFCLPYEANGKGPQKLDLSLNGTPRPAAIDPNSGGRLNVSPDGTPIAPDDDPNNDEQLNVSPRGVPAPPDAEIFRCLSCFSLFIPTGNGCKLFQCFGGSNQNANTPDVQNRPEPTENWWSKIFLSVDKKTSIYHGNNAIVDVASHPVDPQPVQTHPAQTKPLETDAVETHVDETHVTHVDETHVVDTKPLQTQPVQSHEVVTPAVETKPLQTQLVKKYWPFGIFSFEKKKASISHGEDVRIDVEQQPVEPQLNQTHPLQTQPLQSQPFIPVEAHNWDILKSIVHGGLVESITSLGVVSSAAGAGATTLNILALGLASVVGGLFIIADNIKEVKNEHSQMNGQEDRYQRLLGRRQNFARHAVVVVLSFLIFGLLPPVIYGFSFQKSDDRDLKIASVAGSSLACIVLLAAAKAHVQNRSYWKTVVYYVSLGVTASGLSYVAGDLFDKLMEKLGLFTSGTEVMIPFLDTDLMNSNMMKPAWSSF